MTPRISIIIPLYNRATLIGRAIESCRRQNFRDWEVVVVDDCSSDGSAEAVTAIADARVRLIRHEQNMGQCIARNTAAAHAWADWLLFLDSDDEIADGALDVVWQHAIEQPADIGRMFFSCRWDDGTVSPDPPFDGRRLNYEAYVRWMQRMHGRPTETISVVRRDAFSEVPYPNRRTHEGGHNLDFAKRFDFVGFPDVVRLYHLDATNRMTNDILATESLIRAAPGLSWLADSVLERHGDALRKWSPSSYQDYLRTGGLYHLLAGHRGRGVSLAAQAWLNAPLNTKALALLACAWMPARALAEVKMRYSA
jgi:glycosyltransferase involved in cell wall biosynthesis